MAYCRFAIYFSILFCSAIIIGSCSSSRKMRSLERTISSNADNCPLTTPYRKWFFYPPQGTVVGYPQKGTSALSDAIIRARGYSRMFVKGTLRYFSNGPYDDKQDSISFYYDDSDTQITKQYSVVDSFFICCPAFVYLMSAGPKIAIDTSNTSGCDAPAINDTQLIRDSGLLYGKGTCKMLYYDQASSWMEAEEQAVKTLCRQSAIYYVSLIKMRDSGNRTELSKVMRYEMDIEVIDLTVVSRYYEVAGNTCTVCVACRKNDIHPWKGTQNE
jgi:hypothetical protein